MALTWDTYDVTLQIRDRIIGGIPIVPAGADRADAYERWARGQDVENDPAFARPLHEALADELDMPVATEELEVAGLETGFRRDEHGLYLEARQINAMIREAAQRLGLIKTKRGVRQVLQHDLKVRSPRGDQKLYLDRTEPDGRDQRPISVVTRQGPRTALKRFEYCLQPTLEFEIRILAGGLADGLIGLEQLADILEFGGDLGLGADRSQGEGTFDVLEFKLRDVPAA